MMRGNQVTGVRWTREAVRLKRGVVSIMVGRPRKAGRRKPSGRLAQTYVNPKAQAASQPHRRGVVRRFREWPEAGSEFGRSMIRGAITPAQYAAGMRYAELVVAFCAVYDVPSPHPHSIDLTRVGASQGREMPPDVAEKIKADYNAAFVACRGAGNRAQRIVKDCAVLDRRIGDFASLALLRSGLDALVHHFGIDSGLQISSRAK